MDRPKVLLTEGSSLSARHTLFSLGRQHVIDVVDPKLFVLGRASWFVRKWFLCPSFFDESVEYLQFIAQKIAEHKYDVLLPTHDQVFLLARFRDEFSRARFTRHPGPPTRAGNNSARSVLLSPHRETSECRPLSGEGNEAEGCEHRNVETTAGLLGLRMPKTLSS